MSLLPVRWWVALLVESRSVGNAIYEWRLELLALQRGIQRTQSEHRFHVELLGFRQESVIRVFFGFDDGTPFCDSLRSLERLLVGVLRCSSSGVCTESIL